jgi:succinate dehydrogenase / fumarate reductase flavoprotein subunit
MELISHAPTGPLAQQWTQHKESLRLVSPNNRRKYSVIVVGSGLAGAAAAATLGEQGYRVACLCYQDSPRRAHSIAAQGGINAAKNYHNDGDSVQRLFHDTLKGGDFRAREANVYRLAELSTAIIDQCVAQGVPFGREYGGTLANRSFGGAQVSRTFYARGQTGQQLLLGAYSALSRQIAAGTVKMFARYEMLELVVAAGKAQGIVARNLVTGQLEAFAADAVLLATGGYANAFYLSTNAQGCNATAIWRAYQQGAGLANPCFTQIHPTCIPQHGKEQSKLTLMSESLRNDGRVWVPLHAADAHKDPNLIPEDQRDYYLERKYPSYGNLAPRDIASRAAKAVCDEGRGIGHSRRGVYLDFADAIQRLGQATIAERYGNLFDMYACITGEDAYQRPMRIYPALHYTMGGLWVDYNLMSNLSGLFVLGEANFSDHGANRLGASALMQGLADGYFIAPCTVAHYLAGLKAPSAQDTQQAAFKDAMARAQQRIQRLLGIGGRRSARSFHMQLGDILWEHAGMSRCASGLKKALEDIRHLRDAFWQDLKVIGSGSTLNQELERAGRVADFLDLGETLCLDALARNESCGGHFRTEYQTPDGEAQRNDAEFAHVAVWQYVGPSALPRRHTEPLVFAHVKPSTRSYH